MQSNEVDRESCGVVVKIGAYPQGMLRRYEGKTMSGYALKRKEGKKTYWLEGLDEQPFVI